MLKFAFQIVGVFFLFTIYSLILTSKSFAAGEFVTTFSTTYQIDSQGVATVIQAITLTNSLANVYATQYALEVGSTRVSNIRATNPAGQTIPASSVTTDNKTAIAVTFPDKVVGKGQSRAFSIKYQNEDAAQKIGNILEITIPKLAEPEQIDAYEVTLKVPKSFGQPKIITPATFTQQDSIDTTILSFSDKTAKESGITAIFGQYQVINFSVNYHLENRTVSQGLVQVALPPDTAYQKITFTAINPPPKNIESDQDGNWIATFMLDPKARQTIVANGAALLYLEPTVPVPPPQALTAYVKEQPYWPVSDENIQKLAATLHTPQAIYDYVVKTFTYNYSRLNANSGRLGAKDALEHPENALCTEFTDAFITLARAAGIPAREVNGFAYTENPKLKPLSLVQDVLHAWPEYYDSDKNAWIPVDPTWGNTTGVDYFHHLDFNHFVLAIHGQSSERPIPAGFYKLADSPEEKDLNFSFTTTPPTPQGSLDTTVVAVEQGFLSNGLTARLALTNNSGEAYYNIPVSLSAENATVTPAQTTITQVLPFVSQEFSVKLVPQANSPIRLTISSNNQITTHEIPKTSPATRLIRTLVAPLALGSLFAVLAVYTGRLLVFRRQKHHSVRR